MGDKARSRGVPLAIRVLGPVALLGAVGLFVGSRRAKAADVTPPPDGRYANVVVEGRTVPMIHVKDGGSVVLVDTDGKEPRTWKEQFKRQGDIASGTYDVHKTDVNGNGTFADDPIDRRGAWTIDAKGNITAH